jgi:hypothetical protein
MWSGGRERDRRDWLVELLLRRDDLVVGMIGSGATRVRTINLQSSFAHRREEMTHRVWGSLNVVPCGRWPTRIRRWSL